MMNWQGQYSDTVSKALDTLGYSYDSIKARQVLWAEWNRTYQNNPYIIAGSKGEGVTSFFESDLDLMGSPRTIVCCEDIRDVDTDRYDAVFVMDREHVAPGYTRLIHADFQKVRRISHRDGDTDIVDASFQNENGDFLLSSELFSQLAGEGERAGPARNKQVICIPNVYVESDIVLALACKCKSILQTWKYRPRHYYWPSMELIQEISTMDGHVVPVGMKGSDKQYEEWRICYTPAEIRLMKSFNETQLKLYVLLKLVAKKLLKPVCPYITSYVIKNVVFWLIERFPQDRFTSDNLVVLLMFSLRFLKASVENQCLDNYMIPARNLFAGKLEQPQKQLLLERLFSLISDGPMFLLQYPELDQLRSRMVTVCRNPEFALYEQINRLELERSFFKICMFDIGSIADFFQVPVVADIVAYSITHQDLNMEPIQELMALLLGYYN